MTQIFYPPKGGGASSAGVLSSQILSEDVVADSIVYFDSDLGIWVPSVNCTGQGFVSTLNGTVYLSGKVATSGSPYTPGKFYYLQADGTIGLVETNTKIGYSISSNELLLDIDTSSEYPVELPPPTPARSYATWDPAYKSTTIALSNNNTTVSTIGGVDSYARVRSTIGKTTGKWYWEYKANTGGMVQGVTSLSTTDIVYGMIDGWYGLFTNSYGYGTVAGSGPIYGTPGALTDLDVIGVAADFDTGTVLFYRNNILINTVYFPTGIEYFVLGVVNPGEGGVCTANFGATSMAYTAPTGYNQGLYL